MDESYTDAKGISRNAEYYAAHREEILAQKREHYRQNKAQKLERDRRYRETNREKIALQKKRYREANAETVRRRKKEHYETNKVQILSRGRKTQNDWYTRNRDEILRQRRERFRSRMITREEKNERNRLKRERHLRDKRFRIECVLRSRLQQAIDDKVANKWDTTFALLGCSIDDFLTYIQDRWLSAMSWDNYGPQGWHIDHIRPCASFDLTREEDQRACFHWSNMQPLWAADNLAKGARVA
jgi:hypothetical protein